jgi:hypothetical protein
MDAGRRHEPGKKMFPTANVVGCALTPASDQAIRIQTPSTNLALLPLSQKRLSIVPLSSETDNGRARQVVGEPVT